ncbi:serpentine type 7TM GPCR chemoreceptor srh domain-containing protein [Ditylenchus destructor]|uniref:Serpentine type 7TM GPCR chemoreceptor srh domain-containing protein n=1 Tax=Ditylenchus destructor TaxID=166010 RepID=A0AAD4MQB2_9BILA|nr:serpentine type 7TM GPCR chemoreceptor srh domain-containing protein [Ditylenchus destructor]
MDQYLELLKLSHPYRVILVINAVISTILYPYLLYLLIYRSPKEIMMCMRIHLFNATTTCYVVVIVLALWQPIPVMSLLAGYSAGPLRHIGDWINIYANELAVALILNLVQAYTMAYLLYYSVIKPSSRIATWMRSHRKTAICYAILISIVLSLTVILIHYTRNSPEELNEMIDDMSPELQALIVAVAQHESSFVSYSRVKWTKGLGVIYVIFLKSIVVGEVIVLTIMTYKSAKEIQLTKKIVRPSTHQVQMMVFRTFVLKSIFFLLFFLAPLTVVLLSLSGAFQSLWPPFIMYTLWSLHTPLLYIQILVLMRPYRRFTCALMIRTFNFLRSLKCKGNSGREHLDQSSSQISHTKSSATLITGTGSEVIPDRNTKVHPISSDNILRMEDHRRQSLKALGILERKTQIESLLEEHRRQLLRALGILKRKPQIKSVLEEQRWQSLKALGILKRKPQIESIS